MVPSLFSGVLLNGMRHVGGLRMVKEQDWGLDIESAPPLYLSGSKPLRHSSKSHHSESTTKHHHESHRSQFYYNDGWSLKSIAGNKMVVNFHSCWPCYLNLFLSTTLKGPRQEPCRPIQTFLIGILYTIYYEYIPVLFSSPAINQNQTPYPHAISMFHANIQSPRFFSPPQNSHPLFGYPPCDCRGLPPLPSQVGLNCSQRYSTPPAAGGVFFAAQKKRLNKL